MENKSITQGKNRPSTLEVADLLKRLRLNEHYLWAKEVSKWSALDGHIYEALKEGLVLNKDTVTAQAKIKEQAAKTERLRAAIAERVKCRNSRFVGDAGRAEKIAEGPEALKKFQTRNVVQVIRLSDGKIFRTALDAALDIGVSAGTMVRYLDKGTEFARLGDKRKQKDKMKRKN